MHYISRKGRTELTIKDGKQNAEKYVRILADQLIPLVNLYHGGNAVYQQENASIQTSKLTKKWISDNQIYVLKWPTNSPDFNPVENVLGLLVRIVYRHGRQYENKMELISAIVAC